MSPSYPVSQSWNFCVVGGKQCYHRLSPSSDLSYKLIHPEAMRLPFLHRWSKLDLPFTTFLFNLPTYLRMYSIGVERFCPPLLSHSIQFCERPQFLGELSSERLRHLQWFALTGSLVCILFGLCASVAVG